MWGNRGGNVGEKSVLLKFVAAVKTQSHDSLSTCTTSAITALLKPSRHIDALQRLRSDWTASTLLYKQQEHCVFCSVLLQRVISTAATSKTPQGSHYTFVLSILI